MQALQCTLLSAFGWQCIFIGAAVCRLPDPKYFPTTFFLSSQSGVPFPLTVLRCTLWFWWLSCRQDWTCHFWERATNSRLSKNVHVGLLCLLWIQYFFCICKGALPGCLPPFKQRWHLVMMTKMTRYKENWQVWSNVVRKEWETCQKKNGKVPKNWKQTCSLQREATPGQE